MTLPSSLAIDADSLSGDESHGKTLTRRANEGTQSIQRAIAVLRLIAMRGPAGLRLHEIAEGLALERITAHRIVKGLVFSGMLQLEPQARRYTLGHTAYVLGLSASPSFDLRERCQPTLRRLADATGDSVFLMVRSGHEAVCFDHLQGSYPIRTHSLTMGARRALGAGAGAMALLAALPDNAVDAAIAANAAHFSRYREISPERLREMVKRTRLDGYATNLQTVIADVSAIGMTLPRRDGTPCASISIASIASRMTGAHLEDALRALRQETEVLGQALDAVPRVWDGMLDHAAPTQ
ncbi:IclR family transcriptional regulator [Pandoraea fibrosis]|uniref:HTH-type transcriptional regulator KipR n=1 Tax=Pandoraea fibrosis TaxID=1891094 RepID=A0A5E4S0X5_9BURK|nr:IclR family transcriptional regulator C-terminal domain-containing protein [Pandoraea fibrosis]QHE92583.1 helix-turn-helix domain-containing protein [Pandoraea fibrosis]QHF13861.1 helix-turn-helix domain-containing protein [Pandoraea fibrosis]VVD69426.1 HTH-type transcriptional regulator KipR [Pandoraea fibrosis]